MKKIILLLVMAFSVNMAFAQTCKKTCDKKDTYVMKGDVIQATLYHENGVVAQTGFYTLENKLHGEWISFNVKGDKTAVANYDNGAKVGTWLFYHGDSMKEVSYEDSKIAEVKTWKSEGTRVVTN